MSIVKIKFLLSNLSPAQTIFKNTFWLISSEIISRGLLFVLTIWIARHFGVENYGKFAFALGFVTLFSVFTDAGLSTLTTREVARDKQKAEKYISNINVIKLFLGIVVFGLIFLITQLLQKSSEVNLLVYIAAIYMILNSYFVFFRSIFRAFEKMQYEGVSKIIFSILLFLIGAFMIWYQQPIKLITIAYVISIAITLIVTTILLQIKFTRFNLAVDLNFWKKIFSESWPFALTSIFILIYYHIDTTMLSIMKTDQIVGWYNAAYKPILFIIAIRGFFSGSIFPVISKLYLTSLEKMKEIIYHFEKLFISLAFPLGIGITILAPKIMSFLYGKEYLNGTIALQILIWSAVIIYVNLLFPSILTACNRQRLYTFITSLGALVNIIFNLILIPKYHMIGAGIATILAELIVFILAYYYSNKLIAKINILNLMPKTIFASLLMGLVLILLYSHNLFLLIGIGIAIYFLLIYFLKYFSSEEISFIKRFLKLKS